MERDPRQQALADTRARIAEMERLLEELPTIFETKFRQRLHPLLEQQQRLLDENNALRQQLLQLHGSTTTTDTTTTTAEDDQRPRRPRLLPFPGRRLRTVLNDSVRADDGGPPTAASAGPTHR
ncbi:MAG: hypothetical protein VKM92_06530 [Cyanobacteriota bacterium]|nr:hypothetical protein [Cyanobacteriota bacterium]